MESNFNIELAISKEEEKVIINGYDNTSIYQKFNKGIKNYLLISIRSFIKLRDHSKAKDY